MKPARMRLGSGDRALLSLFALSGARAQHHHSPHQHNPHNHKHTPHTHNPPPPPPPPPFVDCKNANVTTKIVRKGWMCFADMYGTLNGTALEEIAIDACYTDNDAAIAPDGCKTFSLNWPAPPVCCGSNSKDFPPVDCTGSDFNCTIYEYDVPK